jgi:hypothetical protein
MSKSLARQQKMSSMPSSHFLNLRILHSRAVNASVGTSLPSSIQGVSWAI